MNDDPKSEGDGRVPYLLTYARASDPHIAALETLPTATEADHLHRVLDRLADVGAVVVHQLGTCPEPAAGVKAVLQKLRFDLGSLMVDACVDAAAFP